MNDRLLTTREVASYLGFSPETLLRRYRAGSYRRTAPVNFASIFRSERRLITTRSSCGCWTRRKSLLDIMHGYIGGGSVFGTRRVYARAAVVWESVRSAMFPTPTPWPLTRAGHRPVLGFSGSSQSGRAGPSQDVWGALVARPQRAARRPSKDRPTRARAARATASPLCRTSVSPRRRTERASQARPAVTGTPSPSRRPRRRRCVGVRARVGSGQETILERSRTDVLMISREHPARRGTAADCAARPQGQGRPSEGPRPRTWGHT